MSAFFRSVPPEKTLLLVDVENGSVATALVSLSLEAPRVFAEHRVPLPILQSVSSGQIVKQLERAINKALSHTSEAAAYMRQHETSTPLGTIVGARLFFGTPWTIAKMHESALHWEFEPEVYNYIRRSVESVVGNNPIVTHPFSVAAAGVANLFTLGRVLVCNITGEIVELLVVEDGMVEAHATIPFGSNTIIRTIVSHAGMSTPEAFSALRLYHHAPEVTSRVYAPLQASADSFAEYFVTTAQELLHSREVRNSIVIGQDPTSEWLARTLSSHVGVARLFPDGGVTRALHTKHLLPHVAAYAPVPDLPLMVEALFMHTSQAQ